ncbi:hypothetical protein MCBMB27_05720 (plasmid) [Methylobacterium phyllosphaerae]|uniref:Calcineurin-like phosphoesterase n=1 Tax=Methylobacterium phyllosphaerae TaxID=418223 RepID=A0AAE8HXU2_9HYPH|nr:metallophosphoesterase [Methylobacterium phyllosphaerae]APT35011.1 hypothetical protein MCBMB27_05720 [Methylobacterium phyllosphaerae]SFH67396.1 Calcineurin-like phosphoesterase [Methylobacterium phyllosphaerae]
MRLWVLSDLHTAPDAPWFPSVRPEFDALVIAGDVYDSDIERSILWTAQVADGRPAVFVPGNHEFWGRTIEDELERAERRAQKEGVTLLNGQGWMAVAGGHFAGGTLWTDLELNQPAGHILYPREFGDPIDVRGPGIDRRAKGRDIARRHRAEVDVLEAILDPDVAPEGPRIVVTHYAPHIEVLPRHLWDQPSAAASASDLGHLTDVGAVHLWICGHIPRSVDFVPGYGTRILSNPRGENDSNPAFAESLIVEVDEPIPTPSFGPNAGR